MKQDDRYTVGDALVMAIALVADNWVIVVFSLSILAMALRA